LLGDPYLQRDDVGGAPDPIKQAEVLEELERRIAALPAGSMSGGMLVVDDLDPASDPSNPYFDHTPRQGLSDREQQRLYDELAPRVTSLSGRDWQQMEEAAEEREQRAEELFREYRQIAPDLAQDTQGTAAAVRRIDADLKYRDENPDRYKLTNRDQYLRDVRAEQEAPGSTLSVPVAASFDRSEVGRTAGISGGGVGHGGTSTVGADGIARPDDMILDLQMNQRRSGYW
jgi:hypothetical protein